MVCVSRSGFGSFFTVSFSAGVGLASRILAGPLPFRGDKRPLLSKFLVGWLVGLVQLYYTHVLRSLLIASRVSLSAY